MIRLASDGSGLRMAKDSAGGRSVAGLTNLRQDGSDLMTGRKS